MSTSTKLDAGSSAATDLVESLARLRVFMANPGDALYDQMHSLMLALEDSTEQADDEIANSASSGKRAVSTLGRRPLSPILPPSSSPGSGIANGATGTPAGGSGRVLSGMGSSRMDTTTLVAPTSSFARRKLRKRKSRKPRSTSESCYLSKPLLDSKSKLLPSSEYTTPDNNSTGGSKRESCTGAIYNHSPGERQSPFMTAGGTLTRSRFAANRCPVPPGDKEEPPANFMEGLAAYPATARRNTESYSSRSVPIPAEACERISGEVHLASAASSRSLDCHSTAHSAVNDSGDSSFDQLDLCTTAPGGGGVSAAGGALVESLLNAECPMSGTELLVPPAFPPDRQRHSGGLQPAGKVAFDFDGFGAGSSGLPPSSRTLYGVTSRPRKVAKSCVTPVCANEGEAAGIGLSGVRVENGTSPGSHNRYGLLPSSSGALIVESDSFTDNFSPAPRTARRKRLIKKMAVDLVPGGMSPSHDDFIGSGGGSFDRGTSNPVGKSDSSQLCANGFTAGFECDTMDVDPGQHSNNYCSLLPTSSSANQGVSLPAFNQSSCSHQLSRESFANGYVNTGIMDRFCVTPGGSEGLGSLTGNQNLNDLGRLLAGGLCSMEGDCCDVEEDELRSNSSSLSTSDSDTGVVTGDEARHGDDEQSDWFFDSIGAGPPGTSAAAMTTPPQRANSPDDEYMGVPLLLGSARMHPFLHGHTPGGTCKCFLASKRNIAVGSVGGLSHNQQLPRMGAKRQSGGGSREGRDESMVEMDRGDDPCAPPMLKLNRSVPDSSDTDISQCSTKWQVSPKPFGRRCLTKGSLVAFVTALSKKINKFLEESSETELEVGHVKRKEKREVLKLAAFYQLDVRYTFHPRKHTLVLIKQGASPTTLPTSFA